MLACNCDPSLGSSSFDEVIATHIAEDFKKKHGLDPREYRKSKEKLRVASSKAKLILSPKGMFSCGFLRVQVWIVLRSTSSACIRTMITMQFTTSQSSNENAKKLV